MQPYFAENEVIRRKAEAKALGDEYLATAHLRKPRRHILANLTGMLRKVFGVRREPPDERRVYRPVTDR